MDILNYKIIKYEDIISIHEEDSDKLAEKRFNNSKSRMPKKMILPRWSFSFSIVTTQRKYELLSASEDERSLWIFAFKWIIQEQKRMNDKKKEIEDTAQRFKNLSTKEKTDILAASLEYQ